MIGIIFSFGSEIVEVRIQDSNCFFRTSQLQRFATIEGLKLDKEGTIKEFPDLEGNEDWNKIAIGRFKEKMKSLKSEQEQAKYIIEDLSKYGYVPKYMQRAGFRPVKLK
jgi:hypothetical protein